MVEITPELRSALCGVSGILVTPFAADDKIAPKRLEPIIDRATAAGVHNLVANGNTGEFYSLTMAEAEAMVHAASEMVGNRVPVLGGVGRSIGDARHLAKSSKDAGAAGILVHQPPDPFAAPRGILDYVQRVADAADGLPLMLYLRNDAIGISTIRQLCEIPSVVGVKWATPTPLKLAEAIKACDSNLIWVGGLAEVWAPPFYAVGARGFTSGLINVWPERSIEIHGALEASDYDRARILISEMSGFEDIRAQELNGTNVTGVKAALALVGPDCGPTRPPGAWPLDPEQNLRLRRILGSWGLLTSDRQSDGQLEQPITAR